MQLVPLVQHSRCPAQTDGFSRRKNSGLLVTLGNSVPPKGNGQPMPPVTWPPSSSILSDRSSDATTVCSACFVRQLRELSAAGACTFHAKLLKAFRAANHAR